jgi:hypothetical protein
VSHRAPLVALLVLAACSSGGSAADPATPDTFLAFGSDLQGYRGWRAFPVDPLLTVVEGIHASGTRIEFVNRTPPHGAAAFPVGTIIVKEIHANAAVDSRTFAMVKRGGGFNSDGALDWEWFELQLDVDPVVIIWRGVGPPLGEKYGGDGQGTCNACHGTGKANDYVLSRALALGNF